MKKDGTRYSTAEQIKRDFPECCAVVDEFRAVFGPAVKPTYMSEGGEEIGRSKEGAPTAVLVSQMVLADKEDDENKPLAIDRRKKRR